VALRAQRRCVQSCRRATRSVQRDHAIFSRGRHQDKTIATNPCHLRLAQAQKNRPCNGRINRVSARFQHLNSNFRRQWMRRGTHPVARINSRSAWQMKVAHIRPQQQIPRKAKPLRGKFNHLILGLG